MATFDSVISGLRARASHSRRVYNLSVMAMLGVTIALVALYLFGSQVSVSANSAIEANLSIMFVLSSAIVRVGAVAIGIYAVQIVFNLARYHIRVAHHLDAAADALELCEGDISKLEVLQRALVPNAIDFGKQPSTPTDKVFELLKEMASKLPPAGK